MPRWLLLLIAFVLPGGLLIAGLELLRRYLDRRHGPHLVDELRDWQRRPPEIPPAHIPPIVPLKARRAKVSAFHGRKVS